MKVEVRFRGLQASETLREHALRRLHRQLRRLGTAIRRVVVRIVDVNGPRGGVDKLCQVTIQGAVGAIRTETVDADAYAAVDVAVGRAVRTVSRELGRARTMRRALGAAARA